MASQPAPPARRRILLLSLALLVIAGLAYWQLVWKPGKERQLAYTCKANLHDHIFELFAYAEDHDGRLPTAAGDGWVAQTEPYLKSPSTLVCPAAKKPAVTSYLLVPEAAGQNLQEFSRQIVLQEDQPRHNGVAHILLGSGEVGQTSPAPRLPADG